MSKPEPDGCNNVCNKPDKVGQTPFETPLFSSTTSFLYNVILKTKNTVHKRCTAVEDQMYVVIFWDFT